MIIENNNDQRCMCGHLFKSNIDRIRVLLEQGLYEDCFPCGCMKYQKLLIYG